MLLFTHRLLNSCKQLGYIQSLRTFLQTRSAVDASRRRGSTLNGRHRDGVVGQRPVEILVYQIIIVYISEDISDGYIMRTGDALITSCTVNMTRCFAKCTYGGTQSLAFIGSEHVRPCLGCVFQIGLHIVHGVHPAYRHTDLRNISQIVKCPFRIRFHHPGRTQCVTH